jgi:hypothetical protein
MAVRHRPGRQRRLPDGAVHAAALECSIQFGKCRTMAEPGSAHGVFLVVADIDAARDDLISRGVEVSELEVRRPSGLEAPEGRSHFAQASFSDPDGNGWVLQEVMTRLPGRAWGTGMAVASLADSLHETAEHHGSFKAVAAPHEW